MRINLKNQKVFFCILLAIIIVSCCSCSSSADNDKETESAYDDRVMFVEVIKAAIRDQIGEDERITDVSIVEKDIYICVDLSEAVTILPMEDLAFSRTVSITDAFLKLSEFDNMWESITVDFGDIGKITNYKSDVKENEYGRYFPSINFILQ